MPPKFPVCERLEFENSPLELVVCQIQFPLILALNDTQGPSDFQKKISDKYPIPRKIMSTNIQIGIDASQAPSVSLTSSWGFEDKDSIWAVSIGPTFLSLETRKYQNFDSFLGRFSEVLSIAKELYEIKIRERLGLRYVDRIVKSKYPELPENWPKFLPDEALPWRSVRDPNESQLTNFETRFFFDDKILAVRNAFRDKGIPGSTESELFLDFDCYTEKRGDLNELENLLKEFHGLSYKAFRWSIGKLIDYFKLAHDK